MEISSLIILISSVGLINILCFFVGAKVGQSVVNKKDIELPNLNPIKAVKQYKEDKIKESETEYMKVLMQNIDNYDGTSIGQQELPR